MTRPTLRDMGGTYCHECGHAKPHSTAADMYYCERTHMRMSAEDFCSRGFVGTVSNDELYSDAQWRLVGEWYAAGYSLLEIAEFLGVAYETARKGLKAHGTEMRQASRHSRDAVGSRAPLETYKEKFNSLIFECKGEET